MSTVIPPKFDVNTHRFEPYKNFKFRVMWDGNYVCGVSKVSALKQTVDTINFREGGDPNTQHVGPTLTKFDPITLERGITENPAFEKWARTVFDHENKNQPTLVGFRKDISIELLNEQGTIVRRYNVSNCWVSEHEMLPELDASSGAYAIERLVIQHEGISRDEGVVEEAET
jgi:phage tail-like protein